MYPWKLLNETHLEQLDEVEEMLECKANIDLVMDTHWLMKNSSNNFDFNFEFILKESIDCDPIQIFEKLLEFSDVKLACAKLINHLEDSISDRILATPPYCRLCLQSKNEACEHAKVGILFSGGIDCTILAILTDKLLDANQSIDLINVSFEKVNRSVQKLPIDYNTPDRISAKESLNELRKLNSKRYIVQNHLISFEFVIILLFFMF